MITDNYFEHPLSRSDLLPDPTAQFKLWYAQAREKGEIEPGAMTLATTTAQHEVSARLVLLKGVDQNGFVFYTHYNSPKALCMEAVPQVALVFWWPLCQRQVRITGTASRVDEQQSDLYFQTRTKDSRLAALASQQSSEIVDRKVLIDQFEKLQDKYSASDNIPRPKSWGGYVVKPHSVEFWQGRAHRLHDRFLYKRSEAGWEIVQLAP